MRSDTGFHVDNGKAWLNNDGTVFANNWMRSDTGYYVQNGKSYIANDGTVFANNWMRSDTGYYIQNGSAWMRNDGTIEGQFLHSRGDIQVDGRLNAKGPVDLNWNKIRLRDAGDNNHTLSYAGDVDGPVLTGWSGGALGTRAGTKKLLQWNTDDNTGNTVQVNGNLKICDATGNCINGIDYDKEFKVPVFENTWGGNSVELVLPKNVLTKTFKKTDGGSYWVIGAASTLTVPSGIFLTLTRNDNAKVNIDAGNHEMNWYGFNDNIKEIKLTRLVNFRTNF